MKVETCTQELTFYDFTVDHFTTNIILSVYSVILEGQNFNDFYYLKILVTLHKVPPASPDDSCNTVIYHTVCSTMKTKNMGRSLRNLKSRGLPAIIALNSLFKSPFSGKKEL